MKQGAAARQLETPESTRPATADVVAFRRLIRERRGGSHAYARLLGFSVADFPKLRERVGEGFSYGAFERFQKNADLSTKELATLVQIRLRTLVRRKESGRLSSEESDRLLRVSRLFGMALALFDGDVGATRAWLSRPAPALDGHTPLEVAITEIGARDVEGLIGRLEHGVFS
jgi:putative toxin-antitoxin system antitoxin component (TIGR02293 family)